MDILDKIMNDVADTSSMISKKAKETTASMRISGEIKELENELEKNLLGLGRVLLANDSEYCTEKYPDQVDVIRNIQGEIAQRKKRLEQLKNERKCSNCGKPLEEGAKFCVYCGTAVQPPRVEAMPNPTIARCPSCGNPLKEGAAFCVYCGTKLES